MTLRLDKDNPLGTKVQTRSGRRARLVCVDVQNSNYPIIAIVENGNGEWFGECYSKSGQYTYGVLNQRADLINVPPDPVTAEDAPKPVSVFARNEGSEIPQWFVSWDRRYWMSANKMIGPSEPHSLTPVPHKLQDMDEACRLLGREHE